MLALLLMAAGAPPPAAAPAAAAPPAAGDAGSAVVAQRGDVRLTAAELRALMANADPTLKAQLESSQTALSDYARQRVLNETLLADAHAKGWDQRPEVVPRSCRAMSPRWCRRIRISRRTRRCSARTK